MEFRLKQGERLDDLMNQGLHLIQSDEVFSFSLDAVLLTHFVSIHPNDRVLDLGTGNGVIPILLTTRTRYPVKRIVGLELQERLADMAIRSVEGNHLQHLIEIIQGDMREGTRLFGWGNFDLVTCNPPYRPLGQGDANQNKFVRIARYEETCTLHDAVKAAGQMVKTGGKVAFVHRPDRLVDLIYEMRQECLEPKRMRLVYPKLHQKPNILLVEAIKNGKPDLKMDPPLIVYGEDGKWTSEMKSVYHAGSSDHGEKI